jgi:hypothetical protein
MSKKKRGRPPPRGVLLPPDHGDPFGPPAEPQLVRCLHCENQYLSTAIRWDGELGLWSCPTPGCSGAGVGFDIHPATSGLFFEPVKWQQGSPCVVCGAAVVRPAEFEPDDPTLCDDCGVGVCRILRADLPRPCTGPELRVMLRAMFTLTSDQIDQLATEAVQMLRRRADGTTN